MHSISSGQETPNISMSLEHSLWARWHRRRQGSVTRPYSMHTGAYRAHRKGRKSREHSRFTMGWKGWQRERREFSSYKQQFVGYFTLSRRSRDRDLLFLAVGRNDCQDRTEVF